jgi:hypothetical protein
MRERSIDEINAEIEINRLKLERLSAIRADNSYDYKKKKGMFSNFMQWLKLRRNFKDAILVNMELSNGHHTHFIAYVTNNSFEWEKKTYIIDDTLKYYDLSSKMWCLDYHEDLTIPVKRKIDVNQIKKIVSVTGITDVDTAINPSSLKLFMESDIIQKILKGEDIEKMFGLMKTLLIIVLIVTVISLLMLLNMSGAFRSVGMSFG